MKADRPDAPTIPTHAYRERSLRCFPLICGNALERLFELNLQPAQRIPPRLVSNLRTDRADGHVHPLAGLVRQLVKRHGAMGTHGRLHVHLFFRGIHNASAEWFEDVPKQAYAPLEIYGITASRASPEAVMGPLDPFPGVEIRPGMLHLAHVQPIGLVVPHAPSHPDARLARRRRVAPPHRRWIGPRAWL